jgi:RNA polymerase-binding transcription factor DksA
MIDVAAFKARLLARQSELRKRLDQIEHDLDETPSADTAERVTEREGDEVLEDLGAAGLQELRAISAALRRIEDDEYGYCVSCGEPIAPARLDAVPHAPRCARCAA